MHYLEISGEKYDSDELRMFVSNSLSEIGIRGFQSIDIDTQANSIAIIFDVEEDSSTVRAITRSKQSTKGKLFHSNNVSQFILELYSVLRTAESPG